MDTALTARELPARDSAGHERGHMDVTGRDLARRLAEGAAVLPPIVMMHGSPYDPALDTVTGDRLWEAGVREIRIAQAVAADDGPRGVEGFLRFSRFLRLLREAASRAITVGWRYEGDLDRRNEGELGCDPVLLRHLPPPDGDTTWRSAYRYGLCHYRVGPGFVVVADRRRGPALPMTLRDPEDIRLLAMFASPGPAEPSAALSRLARLGLIISRDSVALTLPYRLRQWPIPCTAI